MKNFKIFSLTFLLTLGFIVPSCNSDDETDGGIITPCPDNADTYFDINGMTFKTGVALNETIAFDDLPQMHVDFDVDYLAVIQPERNWSFSLMPTANACSVVPGTLGSKEEALVSFSIVTLNDFDTDHLANSNINDLFGFYGGALTYNGDPNNVIPFTQYLEGQTGNLMEEDMIVKLTKAPEIDSEFKVKVMMELSTGEVYESEIEPFVITP